MSRPGRARRQQTLKGSIGCVGIGVHSGRRVSMQLRPAPEYTGIVFRRTDLGMAVAARYDLVADTRLCTVIADGAARVGTIEHVMAALSAAGVDNAWIDVSGPEVPILDGSAASISFLIECAGIVEQPAALSPIEIRRTVRVTEGDAWAELRPAAPGAAGLSLSLTIDFPVPAIGRQSRDITLDEASFKGQLARARTFALAQEIEALREAGLARGGSLDNAIVVDGAEVLNPGGLRYPDEFVRHKLLDAVGDLALAGAPLVGQFVGHKSGHGLNNRLLRALFADTAAWWTEPTYAPEAVALEPA
ncbi:UDP-3-O-acyl-N-acetylglucosamine deacetylase [Acidisphaera rubrifaciens]|uniref:UDP-3-O-acyl-N-acetylglucosamine deacetylase n=1 Tax=Acidisphaera rubrifaciens HS-AP3 TaxID=1231350 RepID=A0A0D6P9U7_9PROT|nr:UDP-3-O-acyl-N-acetylglucosamine deacetylase [Acidisphaera rubrifaciens]GAN78442.1 UDP-3-O-[3-hydroxymyristoyl] N-acetylglucosamine deacetylase [Acidisphaera rubrifaciens HS-AP3]